MKIIKFRAWSILDKQMLKDEHLWSIPYGELFPHTPDQRAYKFMQFTGLKDKNGKEIYEGDILANSYGNLIGKVYYWEGNYKIDKPGPYQHFRLHEESNGQWQLENIEVIGNIYENPELMPN